MIDAAKKYAKLEAEAAALRRENAKVRKLQQKLEKAKRELKAAEIVVKEQTLLLDDFHATNFEIPKQKISRAKKKGSKILVAYTDTHGSHVDMPAYQAFLRDVEFLKPKIVIHMGDVLEAGGMMAAHQTMNYVAETAYTFADDIVAANLCLDEIQKVAPKAEFHMLEGNHDLRLTKLCVTMAMRNHADADFLRRQLAPEFQLHLKKRGINWYHRGQTYHGLTFAGSMKVGKCAFTHPQNSSKHHAAAMANKWGMNVCYGHTHRRDSFFTKNAHGEEWGAWNPGCLAQLRKYYWHSENYGHHHGYALQILQPNDDFLHINVPIINGKSLLADLIKL